MSKEEIKKRFFAVASFGIDKGERDNNAISFTGENVVKMSVSICPENAIENVLDIIFTIFTSQLDCYADMDKNAFMNQVQECVKKYFKRRTKVVR